MAKFLKHMGLLVLVLTLWQTASSAFIGEAMNEGKCVDMENAIACHQVETACITAPQLPFLPEAELAGSSMQLQILSFLRVQRTSCIECLFSLKDWVDMLALRDAVLSLHREKLYDTSTSYRCHPACEYYIFTLKRILI